MLTSDKLWYISLGASRTSELRHRYEETPGRNAGMGHLEKQPRHLSRQQLRDMMEGYS